MLLWHLFVCARAQGRPRFYHAKRPVSMTNRDRKECNVVRIQRPGRGQPD